MIFEYNDNFNLTENIELLSFDLNNDINHIMEEPFPIIPFNQINISAKKTNENMEEISSFKDDCIREKAKKKKNL